MRLLAQSDRTTYCPYKADCSYFSVTMAGERGWQLLSTSADFASWRDLRSDCVKSPAANVGSHIPVAPKQTDSFRQHVP